MKNCKKPKIKSHEYNEELIYTRFNNFLLFFLSPQKIDEQNILNFLEASIQNDNNKKISSTKFRSKSNEIRNLDLYIRKDLLLKHLSNMKKDLFVDFFTNWIKIKTEITEELKVLQ